MHHAGDDSISPKFGLALTVSADSESELELEPQAPSATPSRISRPPPISGPKSTVQVSSRRRSWASYAPRASQLQGDSEHQVAGEAKFGTGTARARVTGGQARSDLTQVGTATGSCRTSALPVAGPKSGHWPGDLELEAPSQTRSCSHCQCPWPLAVASGFPLTRTTSRSGQLDVQVANLSHGEVGLGRRGRQNTDSESALSAYHWSLPHFEADTAAGATASGAGPGGAATMTSGGNLNALVSVKPAGDSVESRLNELSGSALDTPGRVGDTTRRSPSRLSVPIRRMLPVPAPVTVTAVPPAVAPQAAARAVTQAGQLRHYHASGSDSSVTGTGSASESLMVVTPLRQTQARITDTGSPSAAVLLRFEQYQQHSGWQPQPEARVGRHVDSDTSRQLDFGESAWPGNLELASEAHRETVHCQLTAADSVSDTDSAASPLPVSDLSLSGHLEVDGTTSSIANASESESVIRVRASVVRFTSASLSGSGSAATLPVKSSPYAGAFAGDSGFSPNQAGIRFKLVNPAAVRFGDYRDGEVSKRDRSLALAAVPVRRSPALAVQPHSNASDDHLSEVRRSLPVVVGPPMTGVPTGSRRPSRTQTTSTSSSSRQCPGFSSQAHRDPLPVGAVPLEVRNGLGPQVGQGSATGTASGSAGHYAYVDPSYSLRDTDSGKLDGAASLEIQQPCISYAAASGSATKSAGEATGTGSGATGSGATRSGGGGGQRPSWNEVRLPAESPSVSPSMM